MASLPVAPKHDPVIRARVVDGDKKVCFGIGAVVGVHSCSRNMPQCKETDCTWQCESRHVQDDVVPRPASTVAMLPCVEPSSQIVQPGRTSGLKCSCRVVLRPLATCANSRFEILDLTPGRVSLTIEASCAKLPHLPGSSCCNL